MQVGKALRNLRIPRLSPDALDFIDKLVAKKLTAEQALSHKWLDGEGGWTSGVLLAYCCVT